MIKIDLTTYLLSEQKAKLYEDLKTEKIVKNIELPPLIFSTNDFDSFLLPKTLGNFIGDKKIIKECISLDHSDDNINLENKIIIIEKADHVMIGYLEET